LHVTLPRSLSRLDPWAPPLVLMAVIFLLSAQPDLSSGLGLIDRVGRKFVHAAEFGLLAFLLWRALRTLTAGDRALLAAFALTVAYAVSDEWHQTFVQGRSGSVADVAIDAAGASVALVAVRLRAREREREPERV
jgi:VanZ family protein